MYLGFDFCEIALCYCYNLPILYWYFLPVTTCGCRHIAEACKICVFISFLSSLILCNQIISQRKHPHFLPSVLGRKREKIMHYLSSTFVYYLIKMFKSVQVTFSCRTQIRRPMSFNSRGSNTFTCCSWFQT